MVLPRISSNCTHATPRSVVSAPVTPPTARAEQLRQAAGFTVDLYAARARGTIDAHVRRNDYSRLRFATDPYPILERIREAGGWAVSPSGQLATVDHAACDEILRSRRFGVAPENSTGAEAAYDRSFLIRNPPDHTRLRRLVAPAFAPRRLTEFRALVEETVNALLDEVAADVSFDVMKALASPLPVAVINDLLGFPDAEGRAMAAHGAVLGGAASGFRSVAHAQRVASAARQLDRLLEAVLDDRRQHPRDDLISALVAAEGDGDAAIRPHEVAPLCRMLLIAGFETTVSLIGNAVDALLDHPDQWDLLVADPGLAGAAVQETLRFDAPIQRTRRISFDDVEIAGRRVAAGQWVTVLIGGANRDPAVFRDPGVFDITRTDGADHLAFASGIHHCLGRPLAELEATVALRVLAERMPRLRRAGVARRGSAMLVSVPRTLGVRTA